MLIKKYNIPGASIAITSEKKITFVKSFGFADLKKKEKFQIQQCFMLVLLQRLLHH